jgi:NitT/TauT family transport system substrate-binding protein
VIPYLSSAQQARLMLSAQTQTRRTFFVNSGRAMLIGAGLAAGMGRTHVAGAASQVTIGLATAPCHAPTYAAAAQKFFADEGLDATIRPFDPASGGISNVVAALTAGAADAGMATLWSIVPPRLVGGPKLGDVVTTAPLQRGCIALSVPADSNAQSLADLRGAKIAGSKYLFGTALASEGVDPDADVVWSAAPAAADVLATLQSGQFAAVQSGDGQGALLEVIGEARMIVVNNTPPSESNYCCACMMMANAVQGDQSRAAAITRAMMRGSAWAEAHRSETAEIMRPFMTIPAQREITQEDMEATLAMQAFIPMAGVARPILVDEFGQYLKYGLPVDTPMDANTLVSKIFSPVTGELPTA